MESVKQSADTRQKQCNVTRSVPAALQAEPN